MASHPQIHGKTLTASAIRKALGDDLSLIRQQDDLTWADIGRVLGKSPDQVAKYADGTADMPATTLYIGKSTWNGRLTGTADRLAEGVRSSACDRSSESAVLKAALALSIALADDNDITAREVRSNRATLEAARDAIDAQLAKLTPRSAA